MTRAYRPTVCPWCGRTLQRPIAGRLPRHNLPDAHRERDAAGKATGRATFHRCDGSGRQPSHFQPGPCSCGLVTLPLLASPAGASAGAPPDAAIDPAATIPDDVEEQARKEFPEDFHA